MAQRETMGAPPPDLRVPLSYRRCQAARGGGAQRGCWDRGTAAARPWRDRDPSPNLDIGGGELLSSQFWSAAVLAPWDDEGSVAILIMGTPSVSPAARGGLPSPPVVALYPTPGQLLEPVQMPHSCEKRT
ncbi:unnamed protein product [Urochloa humidicola]